MSRTDWYEESYMNNKGTVVSMGYITHPEIMKACDRLKDSKLLGKNNFCLMRYILLVNIPEKKKEIIFKTFPEIKEGKMYFGCTHYWDNGKNIGELYDVSYHPTNYCGSALEKQNMGYNL